MRLEAACFTFVLVSAQILGVAAVLCTVDIFLYGRKVTSRDIPSGSYQQTVVRGIYCTISVDDNCQPSQTGLDGTFWSVKLREEPLVEKKAS
ncbi:hypothetical protein PspLS_09271 [Pyricularia sp. CBS 133598]|nr:hypothetical protein PspLS_09271 [Pyricularia sp. CBS 133598]